MKVVSKQMKLTFQVKKINRLSMSLTKDQPDNREGERVRARERRGGEGGENVM